MHPEYNKGRRSARVRYLHKEQSSDNDTRYTDIPHSPSHTTLAVTDTNGTVYTAATYRHLSPSAAEATAIALPVHRGTNEEDNAATRELHYRALQARPGDLGTLTDTLDPLPATYSDILAHYRHTRREYPPPHPTLTKEQSRIWRPVSPTTAVTATPKPQPSPPSIILPTPVFPPASDLQDQQSLIQPATRTATVRGYLD
ncbi:hypothetical protein HPB48_009443 [Haemaphysalis longicornis]|uniref:Uncharacterized protein n=1 Tax=Haemaphysalis longicornis TaxID=44386 RepID=A0A9J6G4R9_HAELO|nr:hypothetical protein HPB48_009443 [Haemaphysalis longicornis]